jgi:hypothetical protein
MSVTVAISGNSYYHDSTALLSRFGRSSILSVLCIANRTPSVGDQPVIRPQPTHRITETRNKHAETYKPRVGFEHMMPVSEWGNVVDALNLTYAVFRTR